MATQAIPYNIADALKAMDDSPWDDVPSRSHSNNNLAKAGEDENNAPAAEAMTPSRLAEETSSPASSSIKPAPIKNARTPRRAGGKPMAQSTTLQTVDDTANPLGPLGDSIPFEEPAAPAPPVKELASKNQQPPHPSTAASGRSSVSAASLEDKEADGRPRIPPPVQPPANDNRYRQTQPSVSIEQAAKPIFSIIVGDPHTVGNAATSHTVYSVMTRTTSKAYRQADFTVTRRYRDFLWLYNQLHSNDPGVVIPPPPEKQALGRYDPDFVESRRQALEKMLNKTAAHPILQHDGDLKTFLESESFNVDIKHKDHKEPLLVSESTGFMSKVGLSVGAGSKFIEHDDWFHDRRVYLDALETQLKALLKSTDTVVQQRKGLAEACGDFSLSLHNLAQVELSPSLSGPLEALSDLQVRIKELYDRQAMQDVLTLGIVIDEYIRLIGSIKKAFGQREKAFHSWHSAESQLQGVKKQQEKLLRAGRSQQDRIGQMQADVSDAERRVHSSRLLFEDMGRLMRGELERFEREKVEDFKSGVETFLESAVEAQKELIELWETYLVLLDSEDDIPLMAAGVTADPEPKSDARVRREQAKADLDAENGAENADAAAAAGSFDGAHDEEPRLSGTTARDSEEVPRTSTETAHGDTEEHEA